MVMLVRRQRGKMPPHQKRPARRQWGEPPRRGLLGRSCRSLRALFVLLERLYVLDVEEVRSAEAWELLGGAELAALDQSDDGPPVLA